MKINSVLCTLGSKASIEFLTILSNYRAAVCDLDHSLMQNPPLLRAAGCGLCHCRTQREAPAAPCRSFVGPTSQTNQLVKQRMSLVKGKLICFLCKDLFSLFQYEFFNLWSWGQISQVCTSSEYGCPSSLTTGRHRKSPEHPPGSSPGRTEPHGRQWRVPGAKPESPH